MAHQQTRVELCRRYNRFGGDCKFGWDCKFRHACSSCGEAHPEASAGVGTREKATPTMRGLGQACHWAEYCSKQVLSCCHGYCCLSSIMHKILDVYTGNDGLVAKVKK